MNRFSPGGLTSAARTAEESFDAWVRALEKRHLANLTFAEIVRALRALSALYVERRGRMREGGALAGAGKRAAFALFYGPIHYLLVKRIGAALGVGEFQAPSLVDLGCGTGAAGAAWAGTFRRSPTIVGIDRHRWPLVEAAETYRQFGLDGRPRHGDIARVEWPASPAAFLAAFTLNELAEAARNAVLGRLLERAGRGDPVLIVEPLAGFVAPWWSEWRDVVEKRGGQSNEWRFRVELPPIVARLDRAAGLDHRELTGRTYWIEGAIRN